MIRRTALLFVLALLSLAIGAGAAGASKFKPKQYVGHWSGEWHNKTFDTSGPASLDFSVDGTKMTGTFDLGGTAFGCPDPAPRTVTLKKGSGPNTWNSKGFKVRYSNDSGPIKLDYKQKGHVLKGSGYSPCNPSITYSYAGKMTTTVITAAVEILANGDFLADSTLKITKEG